MAFSVANFRDNLQFGGARPSLFEVQVTDPGLGIGLNGNKFTFSCKAAQLPESTIGVIEVPYFGRTVKLAGDRTFAEWTVTIINDEDFNVYDAHMRWMDRIASHQQNAAQRVGGATSDPTSYTSDAVVRHFGKDGTVIQGVNIRNIFPVNVSAIDLAWETVDTLEEFTVTYQFDWFDILGVTS